MKKKTSKLKYKILTTPKIGPKKTLPIIAFRLALTIDVQVAWFGCQMAVCVNKRIKMRFWVLSISKFKFKFKVLFTKN